MRKSWMAGIAFLLVCALSAWSGEEQTVKSRIVGVGLFKNGLATIHREVKLPGPGTFMIEDAPDPVHGTWWVESDAKVEAVSALREVEVPLALNGNRDLQRALANRKVTIFFRDGQIPAATGTVESLPLPPRNGTWNRAYEPRGYYGHYAWRNNRAPANSTPATNGFLRLKSEKGGIILVDPGMIAYLQSDGSAEKVKERRPVLLLTVPADAKAATVTLTYLAKGLSWAPSYKVDISDPKTLILTQNTTIKNELMDLEDAAVQLITGFPHIQFGHVSSLLSPGTSLSNFFAQLNQRVGQGHASTLNVVRQQEVSYRAPGSPGLDLSAQPAGKGVDLHYHSIGKRSLMAGEALALDVATARGPYERIVEWNVPDTRDEWGRRIQPSDYQRQQNPERYESIVWDAVRFKNPLEFPMTTAAATVVSNGRFNGQSMTSFVNSGEQTTIRVNKALSIRSRSIEVEEEKGREVIHWGGRAFRKVSVKGEVTVNNHRDEETRMVIRRKFTGELVDAEGEPKKILREEGVYSVNTRRELIWELTLKPGEEKTLVYKYTVLVKH